MFLLAAAILLPALATAVDFEEEAGVLVLTRANFDEGIKTHKNILVEFYAPWCGHCQTLAPEYVKAAGLLQKQKSPVKLAKVDATIEEELSKKYNVQGYPTLKFFKNSVPTDYTGGRSGEEIFNWLINRLLTKESTGPVHTLTTKDNVDAFIATHERSLILYCTDPNSPLVKMFKEVAPTVKDHTFGFVQDANVINSSAHAVDKKIFIYKQKQIGLYDLTHIEYPGNHDPKELRKFITSQSFPVILEFKSETAHHVFDSEVKTHVLLFVSKMNGDFETVAEPLMELAKEVRERTGAIIDKSVRTKISEKTPVSSAQITSSPVKHVLFVVIDVDDADHEKLMKAVGVKKGFGLIPAIRIIKLGEKGDVTKFKPAEDTGLSIEPDEAKKFIYDYLEGKLESYLLSEKLPKDWDAKPVKVLVSSNFDDIALDKEKDVLVQFYSPWCGYCHRFAPIYDQVAQVFAGKFDGGRDVVIAKIDATANELENTKITHYPTIKLYKKGTNKVVDFTGERSLDALVKFIETGGKSIGKIDEKPHGKDEL